MRIASFDIGRSNFAQYIEDFNEEKLSSLKNRYKALSKKEQRKVKGDMNEEISDILNEIAIDSKRINIGVYNFTTKFDKGLNNNVRLKCIKHLEKHRELWKKCDEFIIEQQFFAVGRKKSAGVNMDAIKLAEGVYTWLLINFPDKEILYFGSQYKTQIFGAPSKMSKPERKKWSVEKSKEIFTRRSDQDMVNIFEVSEFAKFKRINTDERYIGICIQFRCESKDAKKLRKKILKQKQKLDDICDAFIQCQVHKYKKYVACF